MFEDIRGQADNIREIFGPGVIDSNVRELIKVCWAMLPVEQRTVEEVRKEMQRILDRAFADLEEDESRFPPGPAAEGQERC